MKTNGRFGHLTWLHTPSDNSHHIGGVLLLLKVEDVQFHVTGKEDQIHYEATRNGDRQTSHCTTAASITWCI